MASEKVERRLAAILAADVVGFSRLVGIDEEGTIARLGELRSTIIDPTIAIHNGRIVKTTGDGVLSEFASIVDAVRCAAAIQRQIAEHNAQLPDESRMLFRIGVNLGDVVVQGEDILGDGVNIASRLEGLAEPGGICLPEKVYQEVRNKLDLSYQSIGDQALKNIENPVSVYRVHMEAPSFAATATGQRHRFRVRRSGVIGALVLTLLVIAGISAWWWGVRQDENPDPPEEAIALSLQEHSIAVLPFENMSGDPEQDYFADGIAADLITDLSKLSGLSVVARNTSFQYRDQLIDVAQVGRELHVRYILEGSVRKAADQVRINTQLIDVTTGNTAWAERYQGTLADVFSFQDDVTSEVVQTLALELDLEEQESLSDHGTTNSDAYDAFLKGQWYTRQWTEEGFLSAIESYRLALQIDPNFERASTALAHVLSLMEYGGLQ